MKPKYKKLTDVLKAEGKTKDDVIQWRYYGYGFLSQQGECKVGDLPAAVRLAKCFEHGDNVYKVDGAL